MQLGREVAARDVLPLQARKDFQISGSVPAFSPGMRHTLVMSAQLQHALDDDDDDDYYY